MGFLINIKQSPPPFNWYRLTLIPACNHLFMVGLKLKGSMVFRRLHDMASWVLAIMYNWFGLKWLDGRCPVYNWINTSRPLCCDPGILRKRKYQSVSSCERNDICGSDCNNWQAPVDGWHQLCHSSLEGGIVIYYFLSFIAFLIGCDKYYYFLK